MDEGATLLRLQETDLEIRRGEKQLDELPVKKKIIDTRHKIKDVETLKAKAENLVARLERAISRNEDETSQVTQKLEAEQAKVMSGDITNPKEVQHITREMDALRRRREKLEMEDLELMERLEKSKLQVGKVEVALQQLATQESTLTEKFRAEGGELQGEIESFKVQRGTLASSLTPKLLERYETVREAKGGVGAATLAGPACTACHMELPAQRLEELLSGPRIAVCPACRRLLVIPAPDEATEDQ